MRMLDDAFSNFKSEVEPAKAGIAQFEILHDPERMQVVVERIAVFAHCSVERLLSSMPKRRMTYVVDERQSFY